MAGFGEIRGQERAIGRLRAALRDDRVPHAYLFTGPAGVGKLETARVMAQALQCRVSPDDACGSCEQCRKVAGERHPDVRTLTVAEGKAKIAIDQVRELQGTLAYRPFEGRHRVILLPEAERLGEEAANALLKTLEEPPDLTMFILTSNRPQSLLDTIRSRCQRIAFAPLGRDEVTRRLLAQGDVDPVEARVAAGLSEGSVGRASEILSGGLLAERTGLLRALGRLNLEQPQLLLELSEAWGHDKELVGDRLDMLLSWYRDLLVLASGAPREATIHEDLIDAAAVGPVTPPLGRAEALRCLGLLLRAREAVLERNANVRLALERLFLGLCTRGNA